MEDRELFFYHGVVQGWPRARQRWTHLTVSKKRLVFVNEFGMASHRWAHTCSRAPTVFGTSHLHTQLPALGNAGKYLHQIGLPHLRDSTASGGIAGANSKGRGLNRAESAKGGTGSHQESGSTIMEISPRIPSSEIRPRTGCASSRTLFTGAPEALTIS